MLFENKVAIIIGAASQRGIGRATAACFTEHSARVVMLNSDPEAAQTSALSCGEGHPGLAAGIADSFSIRLAVDRMLAHYGHINVLVNNAGITLHDRFDLSTVAVVKQITAWLEDLWTLNWAIGQVFLLCASGADYRNFQRDLLTVVDNVFPSVSQSARPESEAGRRMQDSEALTGANSL